MNNYLLMKRILKIYELEIRKKVRNKRSIYRFELYKMTYLLNICEVLTNNSYNGGQYNLFLIYKPKVRLIMSQNIYDKLINHYVTRYILELKLTKHLYIGNAATRKGMGTDYAIKLLKKYLEINKKYRDIYFLKFDIEKYFYNIDHEILKTKIIKDLNNEEYSLISKIIDSTNNPFINRKINWLNKKNNAEIPYYLNGKGLPIGNMSSQFLAIYYMSDLHKYITEDLNLKYLIIYMDDYLIIHHNKEYLSNCFKIIKEKIEKDYKLKINDKKTILQNIKNGVSFIGYTFRVINKKTVIKITADVKRKIKKNLKKIKYENTKELINFEELFSKLMNYQNSYKYASKYEIDKIINKYWY